MWKTLPLASFPEVVNFRKCQSSLLFFLIFSSVATLRAVFFGRSNKYLMADKKNCKSKCIFISFFKENFENALKQGKNGIEVVKVITFIRGVYEINNFRDPQLYCVAFGVID